MLWRSPWPSPSGLLAHRRPGWRPVLLPLPSPLLGVRALGHGIERVLQTRSFPFHFLHKALLWFFSLRHTFDAVVINTHIKVAIYVNYICFTPQELGVLSTQWQASSMPTSSTELTRKPRPNCVLSARASSRATLFTRGWAWKISCRPSLKIPMLDVFVRAATFTVSSLAIRASINRWCLSLCIRFLCVNTIALRTSWAKSTRTGMMRRSIR